MSETNAKILAGKLLRKLINDNYKSQEEFADDFHTSLRNINRYINHGISSLDTIQEIAEFFGMDWLDYVTEAKKME